MIVLCLDTAAENCAVAVADAGEDFRLLARRCEAVGRGHAERLMPMIGEVLAEAGFTYGDIERIGVTTGPGSFTGTRIGVAAARGLALALSVPTVGVGVLDALIKASKASGMVVAALDARRSEIYAKAVGPDGRTLLAAQVTRVADLVQAIARLDSGPVTLTGSAAVNVAQMLGQAGINAMISNESASADIGTVAALAALAERPEPPVPLYLRPPDAKPQTGVAVARK